MEGTENEQELRNIITENEKRIMKERENYLQEERIRGIEKGKEKLSLTTYIFSRIKVKSSTTGELLISNEDYDHLFDMLKNHLLDVIDHKAGINRSITEILKEKYSNVSSDYANGSYYWIIEF